MWLKEYKDRKTLKDILNNLSEDEYKHKYLRRTKSGTPVYNGYSKPKQKQQCYWIDKANQHIVFINLLGEIVELKPHEVSYELRTIASNYFTSDLRGYDI